MSIKLNNIGPADIDGFRDGTFFNSIDNNHVYLTADFSVSPAQITVKQGSIMSLSASIFLYFDADEDFTFSDAGHNYVYLLVSVGDPNVYELHSEYDQFGASGTLTGRLPFCFDQSAGLVMPLKSNRTTYITGTSPVVWPYCSTFSSTFGGLTKFHRTTPLSVALANNNSRSLNIAGPDTTYDLILGQAVSLSNSFIKYKFRIEGATPTATSYCEYTITFAGYAIPGWLFVENVDYDYEIVLLCASGAAISGSVTCTLINRTGASFNLIYLDTEGATQYAAVKDI